MNKIVAIIQARMGSTRLPHKILRHIAGKPMLQHIADRVMRSKLLDQTIVATTNRPEDDEVDKLCGRLGIGCFRGSADDVLDRYYRCAKNFKAGVIVRITGDCPFADPEIIDNAIRNFVGNDYDYVSTGYPTPTFPDGLDVEVFSFAMLEEAWTKSKLSSEREHVTPYIWKNETGTFKLCAIKNGTDLSDKRWTVDEERDLEFVKKIYGVLYQEGTIFTFKDILALLRKHPEIERINAGIMRNEGYLKSLQQD